MEAAKTGEFSKLPDWMAQPMEKARRLLLQTGDGQACDVLLDRAALEETLREGERSDCPLLGEYAELFVAAADIKIAPAGGENQPAFLLFAGGFGFLPQRGEESPDRGRPGRNRGPLPVSGPDPLWRWGRGPGGGGFRF